MKKLIIFLAGAAAGSLITWYFTKEYYRKKTDEEVNDVVAHFRNAYKREVEEPRRVQQEAERQQRESWQEQKKAYYKMSQQYQPPDEPVPEAGYYPEPHPHEDYNPPYEVTEEQVLDMMRMNDEWEQVELTYYEADDVVVEDREQMENWSEYVGPVSSKCFNAQGLYFVRNEKYKVDYEIHYEPGNFGDTTDPDFGYKM
nr:MAG TPA: Protein of unknown function (DUF1043) [Caudoviricetes sp.]